MWIVLGIQHSKAHFKCCATAMLNSINIDQIKFDFNTVVDFKLCDTAMLNSTHKLYWDKYILKVSLYIRRAGQCLF